MSALDKLPRKKKTEPTPETEEQPKDFTEIGGSPVPGLTLRHVLRGHTDSISRIAWSPDGKYLASPSRDKTIRIWDVSMGECVRFWKRILAKLIALHGRQMGTVLHREVKTNIFGFGIRLAGKNLYHFVVTVKKFTALLGRQLKEES